MQAYQRALADIEALGASLVAVSPESPDRSLSTAEKNELRFEVLSDLGNEVARRYGLVYRFPEELAAMYRDELGLDLPTINAIAEWELPVPGTFVIGPDEIVRLAFVDPDYTNRLEPSEILSALARRGASGA